MKTKSILLLALLIPLLMLSCKKEIPPTLLTVTISQQPVGGSQVNSVSVFLEGIITGTVKPITVTMEWWWESGQHTDQKLKNSTDYTFNSNLSTSKSTVYSAATGYYLLNYYWVKITWTDDDGPHTLESSKAFCSN